MANDDRCVTCRGFRSDHHVFVAPKVPAGCKCDPMDWQEPANVPAICMLFNNEDASVQCRSCEHLLECHQ